MDELTTRFDGLYDQYADPIFRHLYYRLGNRERALDLTQEVFAGLWRQLAAKTDIREPRAYLYRSAHNIFVNELERAKRAISLDTLQQSGFDIKSDEKTAEELAEQRELVEKLETVSEPYRAALILRYVDGLQVKEIAEILHENENTITVRLKRGTEKLRQLYGTI
jgi:RNA polymerase sigma-70 factor, ECF subfamily